MFITFQKKQLLYFEHGRKCLEINPITEMSLFSHMEVSGLKSNMRNSIKAGLHQLCSLNLKDKSLILHTASTSSHLPTLPLREH